MLISEEFRIVPVLDDLLRATPITATYISLVIGHTDDEERITCVERTDIDTYDSHVQCVLLGFSSVVVAQTLKA